MIFTTQPFMKSKMTDGVLKNISMLRLPFGKYVEAKGLGEFFLTRFARK